MGALPGRPAPLAMCCQAVQGTACCDEVMDDAIGTGVMSVQGISVLEWGPGSAPIGKVHDETLENLAYLDRHLLVFSSMSNLAALRWILHLGACCDCTDANGTSCLHAACRSGSLSVVTELMRNKCLIEASDVASWTPLHIAAHMGRREVVIRLLAARASPHRRNTMGHSPMQICIDHATKEVLMEPWPPEVGGQSFVYEAPRNDSVGIPIECEPELFFVTPEPSIRDTGPLKVKLVQLAVRIFNLQPSYGLAFLVASGLTDSYTAAMKMVLRSGEASRQRVGNFLGSTLSLCPLIRFGIFDSMVLLHTGVVSALVLAFHAMQMPEDLQMIDRLVRGVALVWWRKHRCASGHNARNPNDAQDCCSNSGELVGWDLLQYLASSDVLSQLMFSTVLLHWFIYGNGKGHRRELSIQAWLSLNRGIENGGRDVPDHVQTRIHAIVNQQFIPQLALAQLANGSLCCSESEGTDNGNASPADDPEQGEIVASTLDLDDICQSRRPSAPSSVIAMHAAIEGWAQVLNGSVPWPSEEIGMCSGGLPEASDFANGCDPADLVDLGSPGSPEEGFVWASLCYVLIFFAVRPAADVHGAPHAVLDARRMRIDNVDSQAFIITLKGTPPASSCTGENEDVENKKGEDVIEREEAQAKTAPLVLVLLLPDGRWREVLISKLQLKLSTSEEMKAWVGKLTYAPISCRTHAL
mmetsp:Transcript_49971/g.99229  ORF Transcript_49971/g.99229 Transcript_49971/m.99229 type:complete len:697 (+) Transcript_49971:80-2170(+)